MPKDNYFETLSEVKTDLMELEERLLDDLRMFETDQARTAYIRGQLEVIATTLEQIGNKV